MTCEEIRQPSHHSQTSYSANQWSVASSINESGEWGVGVSGGGSCKLISRHCVNVYCEDTEATQEPTVAFSEG